MSTITTLESGLRRILAPNPSPMTEAGTNTYLVGTEALAVIDPGPDSDAHLHAILAAAEGAVISHILVTHAHRDHSALARRLGRRTGAPVLAFGDAAAGRPAAVADLGEIGGGEGVDHDFAPDFAMPDGGEVRGNGWTLHAHWTPGHFGNHLSFTWQDVTFTGDIVMGWATSLVSPPDGDMAAFMASCDRLRGLGARRLYPGHGAPVDEPAARIDALIAHRRGREASILARLAAGPADPATIARDIYVDTPAELIGAATRNVLAHLIDLNVRGLVAAPGGISAASVFRRL